MESPSELRPVPKGGFAPTWDLRPGWLADPRLHIALILLVAGFFRLWQIGAIPPGLFGDEATDGLDALDVLAGRGAVFFPANFGREGLHMWIVAAAFRLLGVTPLALRLPSAIAGILTALATYWLGRELTGGLNRSQKSGISVIPLLAALYTATSFWHVHFSRFGIRGVFTPLCGALAFAAFWRGVNRAGSFHPPSSPVWVWFALSGFFLGMAMHFYTASRFFPFFLAGFLVIQGVIAWASGRPAEALLRRHFGGIILLYATAALVFAPLALYFLRHPGSFGQRAAAVTVFAEAEPWSRLGQAAAANVLQFFVPGRGDPAQFYNLPGRAVFDPLTAVLVLIGIAALAWRWRRPAALFLLIWFPALLLPSFLATDRFPTLPRVLGTIPGVFFFPAVGLWVVVSAISRYGRPGDGALSRNRDLPIPLLLFITIALAIHAGLAYRDYFRVWGPSAATFDAFEGDMTAAWRWLGAHQPAGHVYLSSDIYRHPTFMLLGEQATVTTYFQHRDPNLSWFDARGALPLPPADRPATYLIAASSPLPPRAAGLLADGGAERDRVLAPDGAPALTVIEWPAQAEARVLEEGGFPSLAFTDRLTLTGATWVTASDGPTDLWLSWRTTGPVPTDWAGYRLEVAVGEWRTVLPFDSFRPPEWVADGSFLSWHRLDLPGGAGELPHVLHLRLLYDDLPLTGPQAPDGWYSITPQHSR